MSLATAVPNMLEDPGFLLLAPIGSTVPGNTVAGGLFTDAWDTAWIGVGATEDGSEFTDSMTVTPISAAEFLDPIKYRITERRSSIAFALLGFSLSNIRRARAGGVAALTPVSGTGATALYHVGPTAPGAEVRCMVGWESLDHTVRLIAGQAMVGGEMRIANKKASRASIPCVFNFEVPAAGGLPWDIYGAGSGRG
jgi:hypothetical protein